MLQRLLRTPLQDVAATPGKLLLRALLLVALNRLETRPAEVHTIVDQAVNAAGEIDRGRFKALVNAVLRNRLRRDAELLSAANADPVARFQHPLWWIERIRQAHPTCWEDILAADNSHPPMSLRVNRRRGDVRAYLALLAAAGIGARPLADDDCAILLERPQPVEKLPGFFDGLVSVQDVGAQHAAPLLGVADGMRVLDACAAPGGKATHLLELANIDLLALDAEPQRTARIVDNLARLGLQAEVKSADCRALETWWDGRPFQRILADVPCTASGVVRRHPDGKWLRREADIAGFAGSQAEILDALWHVLAPGGKMLYCTCSLFPQENALQMAAFAARHGDAVSLPVKGGAGTGELQQWQLVPQEEHDGFFYALLQKLA
jgi:16S rRNA (cytosine967-C5)-methyltransferase